MDEKPIRQKKRGLKCPNCYENTLPLFHASKRPPICKKCKKKAWK